METTAVEIHYQHKNLDLQGYSTFPNEILREFYLLELKCKIEKNRQYQEFMSYVS